MVGRLTLVPIYTKSIEISRISIPFEEAERLEEEGVLKRVVDEEEKSFVLEEGVRVLVLERVGSEFGLWESGGEEGGSGGSVIISDGIGRKKKSGEVFVGRVMFRQAFVPVESGDFVVEARHFERDFVVEVLKVERVVTVVTRFDAVAFARVVGVYLEEEWVKREFPRDVVRVVEEAVVKAMCRRCVKPHFIRGYERCVSSLGELEQEALNKVMRGL